MGASSGESTTHRVSRRPCSHQAYSLAPGENMGGSSKETVSTRASIFTRIRPHAEKGGHAARKAGEHPKNVDVKKLGKYDSDGIVMHGGTGEKHFDYMDRVILPPEDQESTYESLGLPTMLNRFLDGYNVTFMAYGQTGTGKTHTMFGSQLGEVKHFEADGGEMPKQWGLFPRALISALERIKKDDDGKSKLTAQVIELYFGAACDLLNDKNKVSNVLEQWGNSNFGAFGLAEIEIKGPRDIAKLIKVMHNNRETRSTGMNETSSRSHCIASICYTKVDDHPEKGRQVRRSTFMFADLAGSERLEKTGLEAKTGTASYEGLSTNWDLYNLGRTIDMVVEAARKGKKTEGFALRQPSLLSQVMTRVIKGDSFVTMVVCLSQSDKNGGESWYSLQYGERLAGLSANISKSEVRNFDDLLRETKKRLEEESKAVERLHKTGGETNPWFGKRTMMVSQLQSEIKFLASLT